MNLDDEELKELENPETWDWETAEMRPPVKAGRTVVSVAFAREDFQLVAKFADRVGKRTSVFIREAALDKVKEQTGSATFHLTSGSQGAVIFLENLVPATALWGRVSREEGDLQTISY